VLDSMIDISSPEPVALALHREMNSESGPFDRASAGRHESECTSSLSPGHVPLFHELQTLKRYVL